MEQTELEKFCRMRNRYGSEFGTCKCKHPGQCQYGPPTLKERKRSRVYNMGLHIKDQMAALLRGEDHG